MHGSALRYIFIFMIARPSKEKQKLLRLYFALLITSIWMDSVRLRSGIRLLQHN